MAVVAVPVPVFSLQLAVHASLADALKGEFELLDTGNGSPHRCRFVARRKLLYDETENDDDYEEQGNEGEGQARAAAEQLVGIEEQG